MAHERAAQFQRSLAHIRDGFATAVEEIRLTQQRVAGLEAALAAAESRIETLARALADAIAAPGPGSQVDAEAVAVAHAGSQVDAARGESSRPDSPTDAEAVAAIRVLWLRGAFSLRECGDIARRLRIPPELLTSHWAKNISQRGWPM